MSNSILICDDSSLARKQLARSLPSTLNVDIQFAEHGNQALERFAQQPFDLLFLDLTMPELDGYGTLEQMAKRGINTPVIVVSGDVQPQAKQKVMALGAKAFIQKPIDQTQLNQLLNTFLPRQSQSDLADSTAASLPEVKRRDIYLEVANISIGRAADALARHFDVFVNLPLPNVNILELGELHMALRDLVDNERVSGVCQGFNGEGIAGEALVLLSDSSVADLNRLMKLPADSEPLDESELLLDVANILVGAFLNGLGEQAEVRFFQSPPVLLGQHIAVESVLESTKGSFAKMMTFEVSYTIADSSIRCDLLLMLVDESLPLLDSKLSYLMEDL
ncbi:response regulator [Vibrio sp.]|uniref:response regulator n=1 Tax=Vibrio sp. TaxID=678 RepID=UPI003D0A03AF